MHERCEIQYPLPPIIARYDLGSVSVKPYWQSIERYSVLFYPGGVVGSIWIYYQQHTSQDLVAI